MENRDDEQRKKAQAAEQLKIEDLQWLMGNARGRRIAYRLLESARIWELSFEGDAQWMAFNEGRRNEGLRFLANITEHCHGQYIEMLIEAKK
jgi:hypothetical protein